MMKKLLITSCILALSVCSAMAQKKSDNASSAPFHKGSNTLGLGVGFGMSYSYYGSVKQSPALALIFDHGIKDGLGPGNLGIGGIIGYKSAKYEYSFGDYTAKWTNIIVAVRATYHLTLLADKMPKFDPYGGVMAGVRILNWSDTYYDANPLLNTYNYGSAYAATGLFVGAKYNFSSNFGAFAELGYDVAFLKLGLHLNF